MGLRSHVLIIWHVDDPLAVCVAERVLADILVIDCAAVRMVAVENVRPVRWYSTS
jgi:hypothetical protein